METFLGLLCVTLVITGVVYWLGDGPSDEDAGD